jgi:hypothetical protein
LDVVTKNLPVALGSTLSETLSTFSACRGRMLVSIVVEGGMEMGEGYSRPVILMKAVGVEALEAE